MLGTSGEQTHPKSSVEIAVRVMGGVSLIKKGHLLVLENAFVTAL
jgi:hypothetical protein